MAKRKRASRQDEEEIDPDKALLDEAKERFKKCEDWEVNFRALYVQDVKFANGDPDNAWQWPDDLRRDREVNKRPALTINKVKKHVNLITNDARQNKPAIAIKPTSEEASFKSAEVFEGVIRDIEYKSNAQDIYDDATDSQVEGGIGYWRVEQYYPDDDSFDQALRIAPVRSHLAVYLDPDIKEKSGLDARYGFVFDEIPRKEFERMYPDEDLSAMSQDPGLGEGDTWIRPDYVRVAEYYRILETRDTLYWVEDDKGEETEFFESEAPKNFKEALVEGKYKTRKVMRKQLEWYKIAGHKIVERDTKRPGKYVPIVRVVGEEKIIAGQLERKGFVRALKDAQRMINYNASAEIESAAMATKTKWVGSAAAFEGNEVAWNNANRSNAAYLTFNHLDKSDGSPLPAQALPQRIDPAANTPAYLTGMQMADQWLREVSGQEQAQLGQQSNEISGKAINARQRQADIATYLYVNNLAIAIRATGIIIIDLFRHIYDTKRVLQILGKDGVPAEVTMDPNADQAYTVVTEGDVERVLFNPNVGKYEVHSEVGPAYSTQRQEAWNAFVSIVTGAPALIDEIGDLMFKSADFPLADKIAERLRRKIEATAPFLLDGKSPSPQMQQLTAALQQAEGQVADLINKLAEKNLELKNKEEEARIRQYEAESKRLTAETNSVVDLKGLGMEFEKLQNAIVQTLQQMLNSGEQGNSAADEPTNSAVEGGISDDDLESSVDKELPPEADAVKDPDGNWYVTRDGQRYAVLPSGMGE